MLYIVLILVLAALAGVVTALITANSLWAWISIGLSVLAGIVLLVDFVRRRSAAQESPAEPAENERAAHTTEPEKAEGDAGKPESPEESADDESSPATETNTPAASVTDGESEPAVADPAAETPATPTAMLPATGELSADEADAGKEATSAEPRARTDAVPGEEETDAADLLIVAELDVEVVVVDEYPRYHLTDCGWLADRDTIPIEVAEARELGFTPCARCGPDAVLAAAHRRKGKSRADR
ncbi:hypothetical protein SAMN05216266_109262 [Amycolatopsis marina]|uniref:Clumping factor A n=1 Tax=Amycolatopsis marina TaxID=490629 RepID=A0A1I1AKQ6_9PSEU|nr:hypothetical protein [Amycolatopsis marina]SFB38527.1 hypothetical protein SAMN05216266_109262 [Amycolatopsis marina]